MKMLLKIQRITFIYIRCMKKINLDVGYHQNLLTESYIALSSPHDPLVPLNDLIDTVDA